MPDSSDARRIYFAGDHAGLQLKQRLIESVREAGHEAVDFGPHTLDPADDYPDYILPLARRVATEQGSRGIVLGGSGQGEAMAANRIPGARAALFYGGPLDIVRLAREHNNANILSIGARLVGAAAADEAVRIFLTTPFSGESAEGARHARRLAKF